VTSDTDVADQPVGEWISDHRAVPRTEAILHIATAALALERVAGAGALYARPLRIGWSGRWSSLWGADATAIDGDVRNVRHKNLSRAAERKHDAAYSFAAALALTVRISDRPHVLGCRSWWRGSADDSSRGFGG